VAKLVTLAPNSAMKTKGIFLIILGLMLFSGCANIHDGMIKRYEAKLDSFEHRLNTQPGMAFNDTATFYNLRRSLENDLRALNEIPGLLEEQQEHVSLLNIRTSMLISSALQNAIEQSKREMDQSRKTLDSLREMITPPDNSGA
jgi:hypothetical protein